MAFAPSIVKERRNAVTSSANQSPRNVTILEEGPTIIDQEEKSFAESHVTKKIRKTAADMADPGALGTFGILLETYSVE